MKLLLLLLIPLAAVAQPVIISGQIVTAAGDKLTGTCTVTASNTFTAADGTQVTTTDMTVPFTRGAFSVALEPIPVASGQPVALYNMNCNAPTQSVIGTDGKSHTTQGSWGPWKLNVQPSSTSLSDVITNLTTLQNLLLTLANISGGPYTTGHYSVSISGAGGLELGDQGGYSINLMTPLVNDSGILQKVEDKFSYSITELSCAADSNGTVQINLDVRSPSTPNVAGANVLGTPMTCGDGTTVVAVSPVLVPAGSPVALDILSVVGKPGVVRVHVSR